MCCEGAWNSKTVMGILCNLSGNLAFVRVFPSFEYGPSEHVVCVKIRDVNAHTTQTPTPTHTHTHLTVICFGRQFTIFTIFWLASQTVPGLPSASVYWSFTNSALRQALRSGWIQNSQVRPHTTWVRDQSSKVSSIDTLNCNHDLPGTSLHWSMWHLTSLWWNIIINHHCYCFG